MSKPELANLVYGYNLANPERELSRYPSPKVDYKGKKLKFARGEGKDSPIQLKEIQVLMVYLQMMIRR